MTNSFRSSFDDEKTQCKDIYEVLSHIAIFKPLISCINPGISKDFEMAKEWRIEYLKNTEHLKLILDYFKNKNNIAKFAGEVEKYYLEHIDALDRSWVWHAQKNIYWMVLMTIREFNKDHQTVKPWERLLNVSAPVWNIIEEFNNKYTYILGREENNEIIRKKRTGLMSTEINSDNLGNPIAEVWEWHIFDFFGNKIAEVNGKYINADTRSPFIVKIDEMKGQLISLNKEEIARLGEFTRLTLHNDSLPIWSQHFSFYLIWKKYNAINNAEILNDNKTDFTNNSKVLRDDKGDTITFFHVNRDENDIIKYIVWTKVDQSWVEKKVILNDEFNEHKWFMVKLERKIFEFFVKMFGYDK